ncbi:carboxymethylenebutenolidase homolog [Sycon ciliatum]|uniref:carboxymethylenebutenolidase homolog n=1 Tax=Sycon ciliatum TaxID=27933 RepID=UPI0031F6822A
MSSLPSLQADYEPVGKEIKVKDLDAYLVGQGTRALVLAHDIFGWGRTTTRARAFCDQLANEGFLVIMPDFYRGTAWPPRKPVDDDMVPWLQTVPVETLLDDAHSKILPYLREEHSVKSIGWAGVCWGGWLGQKVAATDGAVSCGVSYHPSLQMEEMVYGGNMMNMLSAVTCPQLLMPTGNDPKMAQEGGEVIATLNASSVESVRDGCQIHAFPDMVHGFMCKIIEDITKEEVIRDATLAFRLSIDFFKKHMEE